MKRIIKALIRLFAPKIRFDIAPDMYCYVTGYAEIQEIEKAEARNERAA